MTTTLTDNGLSQPLNEPVPTRQHVVAFGFYLYLLSDGVLFASLFATFAVLRSATEGGPELSTLFDLKNAYFETLSLLTSSFTCGMAMIAADRQRRGLAQFLFALTVILGALFLLTEVRELVKLSASGSAFSSSAALTSFFTLVSTHGLHVTVGLIWLIVSMVQIHLKGITSGVFRRLLCFSLFWHVLDIVWIAVFTFVYLVGVSP
jgi:cytochrome o ubiquinol oxidase subunit III